MSTKMEFFFPALSRALEYFGGVPEVSKTDNMLQWVKRYDRYEPALNEAAEKWAMHYGTDIEGCRSRKPRDKGPAEGLVAKVYQFYYSRIYNETWTSLEELNNRIFELNDLYNNRIKSGLTYSRYDKFVKEEQPYLLPLPDERFMFKYEKAVTINSTYHVQSERGRFYSVPYQLVGQSGKVCMMLTLSKYGSISSVLLSINVFIMMDIARCRNICRKNIAPMLKARSTTQLTSRRRLLR